MNECFKAIKVDNARPHLRLLCLALHDNLFSRAAFDGDAMEGKFNKNHFQFNFARRRSAVSRLKLIIGSVIAARRLFLLISPIIALPTMEAISISQLSFKVKLFHYPERRNAPAGRIVEAHNGTTRVISFLRTQSKREKKLQLLSSYLGIR